MLGKSKFQISRSLDERIKRIIGGTSEYNTEFAQVSKAYILGFNYGNITNCVGLTTNYQLNHAVFPVVGIVFFKTSPSDEEIKESLKSIREYSTSPNGLGSFKADKNEHLFLIYSISKADSDVEKRIFNFNKGTFVHRRRLRLNVLDDPCCPRQIHQGSEDLFTLGEADSLTSVEDDHIDHLIFFVHGVGGVCDVRFRSCAEVVADFKKMANYLLAQHNTQSSGSSSPSDGQLAQHLKKGFFRRVSSESSHEIIPDTSRESTSTRCKRVECLPISWHSCTRRQTGISDQLNLIALSSVPRMRYFMNKIVLDAMLYSSGPIYNQTILNNVVDEINRLYTLFLEKHPNFSGSVSFAGHSLGSVILFDLLANQHAENVPAEVPKEEEQISEGQQSSDLQHPDKSITETNQDYSRNPRRDCTNVGHQHNYFEVDNITNCYDYKNLEELLKDMDLYNYIDVFRKEHVDLNTLTLLTDFDMKELKLPLGARRRLGTYINFKKVSRYQSNNRCNYKCKQHEQYHNCENNNNYSIVESSNTGQYLVKYPQLKFKPRCFFAFGSPAPMFLNIRGIGNISKNYKLPTCDRMFNIYHPYDPLAYRFEPLIDARFKNVEPVQVLHHRGGKRIHVQLREGFARVGQDLKHRFLGSLKNSWFNITRFNSPTTDQIPSTEIPDSKRLTRSITSSVDVEVDSLDSHNNNMSRNKKPLKRQQIVKSYSDLNISSLSSLIEGSAKSNLEADEANEISMTGLESFVLHDNELLYESSNIDDIKIKKENIGQENQNNKRPEFDPTKIGRLNGGRRLDYVLQEKPIELFNEYIFAFTSHASYWQNEDSAMMMLNEIYQVDGTQLFELE